MQCFGKVCERRGRHVRPWMTNVCVCVELTGSFIVEGRAWIYLCRSKQHDLKAAALALVVKVELRWKVE